MNYHREWEDDSDELSEFDLAGSADPAEGADPEEPAGDGPVPDEADPADAAHQLIVVEFDEDEPRGD
ncbi:hypothetical protein [Glycomyces paridis]|uniref:Uncharacterized protein n=1 Tax=Glycomyces paridis TaxID=2126555 RepID=A0A4V4HN25_9ACTN|nr:hypothetical protein [Glycomyces paridis]THV24416.1 hypothetical protein E9998_21580 [Glycomyces paridis]